MLSLYYCEFRGKSFPRWKITVAATSEANAILTAIHILTQSCSDAYYQIIGSLCEREYTVEKMQDITGK